MALVFLECAHLLISNYITYTCFLDGVLGHDAQHLIKRLCDQIATKWEKSHCEVMRWVRAKNGFCYFMCNEPLLAWIQGKMEKWTWYG